MHRVTAEENHDALIQFKMIFPAINGIRWQIHITHGPCGFRNQDATMSLDPISLDIGKRLAGVTSIISLTHCYCLHTV